MLKTKIKDLQWDYVNAPFNRIMRCLQAENITTVEEVLKYTQSFYRGVPNFGNKCFKYLIEMFESLNMPIPVGSYETNYTNTHIRKEGN